MPTIGVAIAIPQPFEAVLADQRAAVGDPLAASVPPHVTLLPPTVVTDAELADFVVHLAQVAEAAAPFEMALQSTGTFRPVSPVVFVQVARGISDCELLERAIRSGPIERDVPFAYHPHVSIAHHLDDAALDRRMPRSPTFRPPSRCTPSVSTVTGRMPSGGRNASSCSKAWGHGATERAVG